MTIRGQQVLLFGVAPLDPTYALAVAGEPGARVWVHIYSEHACLGRGCESPQEAECGRMS